MARSHTTAPTGQGVSTVTVLTRVRVLVLAFAILAAGLAAVGPRTAEDASAGNLVTYSPAGNCNIHAEVLNSGGYAVAKGRAACYNSGIHLRVRVDIHLGSSFISSSANVGWTQNLGAQTSAGRCNPGASYTAVTYVWQNNVYIGSHQDTHRLC